MISTRLSEIAYPHRIQRAIHHQGGDSITRRIEHFSAHVDAEAYGEDNVPINLHSPIHKDGTKMEKKINIILDLSRKAV